MPEERREIERAWPAGKMRGVISTSALEMGIDIGGLDVCILVGYPGTMVTTWQRAGRVGRQGRDSLIVLVAQADALDQYFIKYPEEFFGRPMETAVVDPDNPFRGQGPPALRRPGTAAGDRRGRPFSTSRRMKPVIDGAGPGAPPAPFRRGRRLVRPGPLPPEGSEHPGIGESFAIFQIGKKRPLGSVDGHRALRECHPGAIYLHKAQTWVVENLDLDRHNVWVNPIEPNYFTRIQTDKETEILEMLDDPAGGPASRPTSAGSRSPSTC